MVEDVVSQLREARAVHEHELKLIDRMLAIYDSEQERHNARQARTLASSTERQPRRRGTSGRGTAAKKEREDRTPGKTVMEELTAIVRKHAAEAAPFLEEVPGSFTTKQIKEESGRSVGTVRAALNAMEDSGFIREHERVSWKRFSNKPSAPTTVFVLAEAQPPSRGWGAVGGNDESNNE